MNDLERTAGTDRPPPVLRAVADRVRLAPGAEAVTFHGDSVTYRELWTRSELVARRLAGLGAGAGTRVGLHLDRSIDLVVALVGVMRAGGVAVPLDPAYPVDRLRYMCADAGAGLVVGHAGHLDRLGGLRPLVTDGPLVYATRHADDGDTKHHPARTAGPDDDGTGHRPPRAAAQPDAPLPQVSGEDLAYVMYTSGSTGRPKGVLFEHRNLANLIAWQIAASGCGEGDRTLQFSPAAFDVVYQEVLTTLGEGGTVVCCTEDERLDPQFLWELIARERVNRLFVPFAMLRSLALFADDVTPGTHPLREIYSTGEQMQCDGRLRALFARLPGCRLANQWGTTETHVATCGWLPEDVTVWPRLPSIGTPIDGTRIHVCDEDGRPLPPGRTGELWIAGEGVGPGFVNLPDRTARSYVPDPLDPAVRAYRTGDLGRVGGDGELECLGRRDGQVKLRGFRVELGEIETLLTSSPSVAEAVVAVVGEDAEEQSLRAFVVATSLPFDRAGVLAMLRDKVPAHMVPSRIEVVSSFPRTPSGKLDRLAVATSAAAAACPAGPTHQCHDSSEQGSG
ncbi:amino acid adenylation domain-containing protein [Streptosporangium sp. NPDC002524]|uniref:amino acid adenylation domain-containing protein n=1 Tax=Streptosporangium sp. NPDC002524 TaxID=3154537 RepID=UPI003331810B